MKKKKLSSWKNITNFLYNHFLSGILASFEKSTFSWLIFGQISRFAWANLPFSHEIRDFFSGKFPTFSTQQTSSFPSSLATELS